MKKKLLYAAAIFIGLIALFAIFVAVQPADYKVVRTITINAPPEKCFEQINDFHNWNAWSPWVKLDPNAKYTYEGPTAGTGAIYKWVGNDQVGEGEMTILESVPGERIAMKLEFKKPFNDICDTDFAFKSEGTQTAVTWTMVGKKNFFAKAICLFTSIENMLGENFDEGLGKMKAVVETPK